MRISLKYNLISMFLVSLALLTVSYASFSRAKKSLEMARLEQLQSIAALKVGKIQTFIFERTADITTVQGYSNVKTNLPIMSQYQENRSDPTYLQAKKMLDVQLRVFQQAHQFVDLVLLNRTGELVYAANPEHFDKEMGHLLPDPDNKAFEEGKKSLYITEIFEDEKDGFKFFISAPVHDLQEKFVGVVVFGFDLYSSFRFIQDTTGLERTGETLIGKKTDNGLIFLNTRRHKPGTDLNQGELDEVNTAYPMRQAVQGKEGSGISIDYRGEEVLALWRFIPQLKVGLVAKIDVAETYSSITQLKRDTFLIAITILFITFFLSAWLSKTLSKPIIQLSGFAKKVGSGDLAQRITLDSKDEIGQLATSFNEMTQALSDAQGTELAKNLKRSEAQKKLLESQAKALKRTNSELQQFTYVVSHDLKAPFRAIHNYADFLQKDLQGKLEEEQEMYLEGLGEAVRDGEQFLDDLLDLSRIGKNRIKSQKTPLGNFLRDLISSLNFPPDVEFVIREEWPTLNLEPTLARQVFQNLISNGVKFNTSSEKRIEVGWQLIEHTHHEIYFKDNGIGIEPRFFDKVFLPFQQLNPNDVFEGSGIGLATVKKAADIMQWSIRIESEAGQGSIFFVNVPIT